MCGLSLSYEFPKDHTFKSMFYANTNQNFPAKLQEIVGMAGVLRDITDPPKINQPYVDPLKFAESVNDEASFVEFIRVMSADWEDEQEKERQNPSPPYSCGANGWENGTIGTFLEAAHQAWVDNAGNPYRSQNPWRTAAVILARGKHYE